MQLNTKIGGERVLYFHTGSPKTGSSSVQEYLVLNKTILGNNGVGYAIRQDLETHDDFVGNGQTLFKLLYGHQLRDEELEDLLNFYLDGKPVGVCSSENFIWFGHNEWSQINAACQRMGVLIKTITLVRNIYPFYRSAYGQLIKNSGLSCTFRKFCADDQYRIVMDSLRNQLETLGLESMTVIHYESAKKHLDTAFMSILGLACELFDRTPLRQTVNRSLIQYEEELLLKLNQATGGQCSHELSRLLITNRPQLKEEQAIDAEVVAELHVRHEADLKWINLTYFGGENVLEIQDASSNKQNGSALSLEDRQSIDQDVIVWALEKLQAAQDASISYVANYLCKIDWKNSRNPAIPSGFDPIAYLLLNQDVLKAGVPPYHHFIVAGRYEPGRLLKWPEPLTPIPEH
jgi:hypothetical protein